MTAQNRLSVLFSDIAPADQAALQQRLPTHWHAHFVQNERLVVSDVGDEDTEVLCVFVRTRVDESVLRLLPRVRLVATRSAGFDHIDLQACRRRGIAVCRVPDYGSASVAEHAFALLLGVARHLTQAHERARQGSFAYRGLTGFELEGKTLGIVGLGRIGRHVARIALGFGMEVLAYDPALAQSLDITAAPIAGVRVVTWEQILQSSDVLSLHVPATQATHHLLDGQAFARVKPGMVLINTARGALIDEAALLHALEAGTVAAAGLDVLEQEGDLSPEVPTGCGGLGCDTGWSASSPLLTHPRVLVTPHVGFNTSEAIARILDETISNIAAWHAGRLRNRLDEP
ncbi:hydroxyacid dehydrogenase [Pseudomonas aeruginosa]|uniref:hydroxyacid dehydrogenase n=1 Tax=Pseudomonas aeruginosa TaxID=287 RepID=UPI0008775693|nr:hydroxyacid dehydrogenase [Pseudomonas aeruginosa]